MHIPKTKRHANRDVSLQSRFIVITLPSFYYGCIFAWSVGLTVVISRVFEAAPYEFGSLIVGVTYLAFGIGSLLGKWVSAFPYVP
jgi:hypothetical protein